MMKVIYIIVILTFYYDTIFLFVVKCHLIFDKFRILMLLLFISNVMMAD